MTVQRFEDPDAGLPEVVESVLAQHPSRENRCMRATRDLGLRHSPGHLVAMLDADDVWLCRLRRWLWRTVVERSGPERRGP